MEWHKLYPQNNQPSFEAITEYIGGESADLWTSLFDYMASAYNTKPKMTYSVCSGKPGWNVKFQKSGQSFGTLYPEKGAFSVFIVISYKHDAVIDLMREQLSLEICKLYDYAQDYMKMGKWLMFQVNSEASLKDYKQLMSVKLQPRKQEVNKKGVGESGKAY